MADQSFSYIGQYEASGGLILNIPFGGTLDDGAGGNTFDTGDTNMVDGLFLGEPGDAFVGTWSDGTNTFIVCLDASSGDHYMYGPAAPIGGFPATFAAMQADAGWSTGSVTVQCFAAGTKIVGPNGAVAVERLEIGDLIATAAGTLCRVKWIGHQTVMTRFGPAERLRLVRFSAGALGDGLPTADLTVTADHGMLVDGVICHAGALVNRTSITRVPLSEMGETYIVYHIETEAHEIILANGAPAETFIDNVSRRGFDNYAEFEALYGDVPEMEELPYPRAMSARQVPERIRARLSPACAA
ncbi:Hint domain-containing protein [Nioella ostreopsis]|uniref:Hint domain-containing protein n=1 Tax=Nioella ostreopsis TaxID=2448479 RepID=UPI000FD784D3|nr:Hint domain-containing protein [Nioella ostreopsis]